MSFDPGAQLDPGQISDRRGMGGRGGIAVGGGGLGLVLLLVYVLLGGNPNDLGPLLDPGAVTGSGPRARRSRPTARPAQDANTRDDCRILGYVNSVQAYWTDEFAAFEQDRTSRSTTVLFSGATQTGCGTASAATGPFYCPTDQLVYLDLGFFDELRDAVRRPGRLVRPGLRGRPRVRPPRPGPARHARQPQRRATGAGRWLGPDGAPGRLLRRRLGQPRRGGHPRAAHARPDRGRASTPRPRSATTGSRRRVRARSTRRPGRTARRRSARSGSRRATRAATRRLRHVQRRDLTRRRGRRPERTAPLARRRRRADARRSAIAIERVGPAAWHRDLDADLARPGRVIWRGSRARCARPDGPPRPRRSPAAGPGTGPAPRGPPGRSRGPRGRGPRSGGRARAIGPGRGRHDGQLETRIAVGRP